MACNVSLHPIYYNETGAVYAAMRKYRTSSGDAGEKAGGSATVTINGIQITGAYTDSDDGCDTYKAAGAQFTLTADGVITRFSASGDECNARTETVSTEEALQLCRDFLAEHCPFATDFEEDLSSRTQYDPENGDDEYRFSFARMRGSIETASVFIEMDGCGNIRYVYASAPELWQIEALPDDASIISATEEKLGALCAAAEARRGGGDGHGAVAGERHFLPRRIRAGFRHHNVYNVLHTYLRGRADGYRRLQLLVSV